MSSIIKVDTIQNQSGANIISESANTITVGASGDTVTIPSGATLGGAGTFDLTSSSVTLNADMKNTPAFHVQNSSNQSISNLTLTKVNFANEIFDTDNCFASSRFTPTVSGKYCIYAQINFDINTGTGQIQVRIMKNGNLYQRSRQAHYYGNNQQTYYVQAVVEMNGTTDYIEIDTYQDSGSTRTLTGDTDLNYFGGYRLIGA